MGVTEQIVLNKDGFQTNGKNYKIAAISNTNQDKNQIQDCAITNYKIHMAKLYRSLYKTIMKHIIVKPSRPHISN